ncbi:GNAT family N-acetyltransferase [Nocardia mexicana]|uniref:Acetyltransferase (GNAT) family protein n=1 Tax=Nocardia mexicana TaxID=279262 RepID=A0A370H9R2_9NOCA|nr:GNAT family N-acetyltransferase [Nocardia mexicana]RDI53269.1 acetyltransferase (GNAT) family protein [Nocardia mexicana]
MTDIREIPEGQTKLAAPALLELRPQWKTTDALVELVDRRLRPGGYRIVGAFDDDHDVAVSILGFRDAWAAAWGHHLYVDDVSTLPEARGRGHADRLVSWIEAEARRLGCESVELVSAVGAHRAAAHRLYMRHHLTITAHHFTLAL